ncbi:MAG TPA: M48 family metallopeptidase [Burkholderiales bacterium]|jgi:Zn-dependent protease with chaperone function
MHRTASRVVFALATFVVASTAAAGEIAQTVLAKVATDAVVVVRSLDRQAMTMEIESPSGQKLKFSVPEARNLDAIEVGSRFCVRLSQSVSLSAGKAAGRPSLTSASTVRIADKGARPAAALVSTVEVQGLVKATNVSRRTLTLTGPGGGSVTIPVRRQRADLLSALNTGDMVVARYSETFATGLVGPQQANCPHELTEGLPASPSSRDTHTVQAIRAAARAPIPSDVLKEADEFDQEVLRSGQVNGRPVSQVSDERYARAKRVVDALLVAYGENPSAWHVRLLDSNPPRDYAFTVGGRNIYIFTGLLGLAQRDDELAFVLAHEIAHSRLHHIVRRRETFPPWLAGIMEFQDLLQRKDATKEYLDSVSTVITSLSSRIDEQEADALGAYATMRAGLDPLGGAAVFKRLMEGASRPDQKSALLDQHPANQDRITALVAANDYLLGKRTLESLAPLGQGYNVFVALGLKPQGKP